MTEDQANWEQISVRPETTLIETMETITQGRRQISVVVDAENRLMGTVTDGDIRRAILSKVDILETHVATVMQKSPHVAQVSDSEEVMVAKMREHKIRALPVLDQDNRVVSIVHLDSLMEPQAPVENWVVIMAGGLGKRLRPLTEEMPKPLLPVGSKPLLETIVENFQRYNFRQFYFAVNYKADQIRNHFGDGGKWNAEIRYLEEETRLGTAGALRLIEERPTAPIIVMNGDLLTRVDFEALLDFHLQEGAAATMCVREYDFQVPFGVVELEDQRVKSIVEKPVQQFFVNAGIYVLNPDLLDQIPADGYFDMTTLFENLIENGQRASVFPVKEYWLDVGRIDDLDLARLEYEDVFGE
jgi:dTDP-glucose pyrophosphorylase